MVGFKDGKEVFCEEAFFEGCTEWKTEGDLAEGFMEETSVGINGDSVGIK